MTIGGIFCFQASGRPAAATVVIGPSFQVQGKEPLDRSLSIPLGRKEQATSVAEGQEEEALRDKDPTWMLARTMRHLRL